MEYVHPVLEYVQSLSVGGKFLAFTVVMTVLSNLWYWMKPSKNLSGQVALVTGGGSGIGRLLAYRLAELGCTVVIWDLNLDGAIVTKDAILAKGGRAFAYKVDVTNREAVYALAAEVKKEAGSVSILINNAGIVSGAKFLEVSDQMADLTMKVNTIAHFWTVKAFLPDMLVRDAGHVVSIASAAGHNGVAGLADYCASKFGAVGFMEGLRLDLMRSRSNVACTTINPYYINTGMFDGVWSPFWLPILDQHWVVNRIVRAIRKNEQVVLIPGFLAYLPILKALLPVWLGDRIGDVLGIQSSMDTFKGRNGPAKKTD